MATQTSTRPHVPAIISAKQTGPRRKAPHSKLKTGCVTCKRRRVRCDEEKPCCKRCAKAGKECEGYDPPRAIIFQIVNTTQFESPQEARSFQYFTQKTGACISTYQNAFSVSLYPFVSRASDSHPAIKHMLIALAAVQESYEAQYLRHASPTDVASARQFGLSHYTKALATLTNRKFSDTPVEVILTCCLLFACYEMFHFNCPFNVSHIYSGLKILRERVFSDQMGINKKSADLREILIPAFKRLGVIGAAFVDDFPVPGTEFTDDCAIEYGIAVPDSFSDIFKAHETMVDFISCILRVTYKLSPKKIAAVGKLHQNLPYLLARFEDGALQARLSAHAATVYGYHSLIVHHRVAKIMLDTLPSLSEDIYDPYTEDFRFIANECKALLTERSKDGHLMERSAQVSLGFIPPLFFTATKCRDPEIRELALSALHLAPRWERSWTSCAATQTAREVCRVEATRGCRVKLVAGRVDDETGLMILNLVDSKSENEWTAPVMRRLETKAAALHMKEVLQAPRKVLRACGYSGSTLTFRGIECHCVRREASPSESYDPGIDLV